MNNSAAKDNSGKIKVAIFQKNANDLFKRNSVQDSNIDFIYVADSYRAATSYLRHAPPDVLVTDTSFDDGCGIEIIRECKHLYPQCEVLVLSDLRDERTVFRSLSAGATGYLLKDCLEGKIDNAISDLYFGGSPLSPEIARMLIKRLRSDLAPALPERAPSLLTKREVDVLNMIGDGHSDKSISDALAISCLTVQTHTKNIYRKLGVRSRTEALFIMRRQGYMMS